MQLSGLGQLVYKPARLLPNAAEIASAGATLRLWLKAEAASLFTDTGGTAGVAANNDPVAYWLDSSGQGNHPTQSTLGSRPLYKTAIVGSRPGVLFDGVGTHLRIDALAAHLAGADTPVTILWAAQRLFASPSSQAILGAGRGSSATPFNHVSMDSNSIAYVRRDDASVSVTRSLSTGAIASPYVGVVEFAGTTSILYVNPTAAAGSSGAQDVGTLTLDRVGIGCRTRSSSVELPLNGYLFELIVFSGLLLARHRIRLAQYLRGRWRV